MSETAWFKVEPGELEIDRVTTVVAAGRAVCITRTANRATARSTTAARTRAGRSATARSRTAT